MAALFPHLICVSWQIFLLFSWVPHDHRHYHHCFLFPLLVIYKSSPAFSQRSSKGDWMGFTNWPLVSTITLPDCDNATLFKFSFSFPLGHTNPYYLISYSLKLSINVLFLVISFCIVSSPEFWFYWFGASMHEVNVLYLEWQPYNWNSEEADTGILLCGLAAENILLPSHHTWSCFVSVIGRTFMASSLCQSSLLNAFKWCECVFAVIEVFVPSCCDSD